MRRQRYVGDHRDVKQAGQLHDRDAIIGQKDHRTHLKGSPSSAVLLAGLCSDVSMYAVIVDKDALR